MNGYFKYLICIIIKVFFVNKSIDNKMINLISQLNWLLVLGLVILVYKEPPRAKCWTLRERILSVHKKM